MIYEWNFFKFLVQLFVKVKSSIRENTIFLITDSCEQDQVFPGTTVAWQEH